MKKIWTESFSFEIEVLQKNLVKKNNKKETDWNTVFIKGEGSSNYQNEELKYTLGKTKSKITLRPSY